MSEFRAGAARLPLSPPLDLPMVGFVRQPSTATGYGRHELETIRRLIGQLDVNIYGGRRVFIYYAENAKSKDLAATLNAIYTGRETVPNSGPMKIAARFSLPPSPLPSK